MMKSVIVMCLFGFSFGAPHLQKESIIPTERGNEDELTGVELIEIGAKQPFKKELREEPPKVNTKQLLEIGIDVETLLAIAAGEALAHGDVEIISELLIGFQVKEGLKLLKHVDTEKLLEIGFDPEIFLEEVLKEALTRIGVENIVKRILTGEDVEALFEEALSLEEVEKIFNEKFKGVDKKSITKVFKKGIVSGIRVVSPIIGPKFAYRLLLDNGIAETRIGSEGPNGTSIMHGSYTIPLGRGDVAIFNWVADENGYRVESPYLPTPPPPPSHVAKLLRLTEEQRAAGIPFDGYISSY